MLTTHTLGKYTSLATAAFLGSFGLAIAQSATPDVELPPAAPEPMSPAKHNAITRAGQLPNAALGPSVSNGWNYLHLTHCTAYNGYLYAYGSNTSDYFWTNNSLFQNTLEPECALGHWVAFYVYGNSWYEIYTYTY